MQHNIVKAPSGEREVQRRKEKQERLPSKLHERQDEMRRRKQREKVPAGEDTELGEDAGVAPRRGERPACSTSSSLRTKACTPRRGRGRPRPPGHRARQGEGDGPAMKLPSTTSPSPGRAAQRR